MHVFSPSLSKLNTSSSSSLSLILSSSLVSIFLAIFTLGYCFSVQAQTAEKLVTDKPFIEVITSDSYPVSGLQSLQRQGFFVMVYNLDDGKTLVSTLGSNLPHNQNAAKKYLQQQFKRMGTVKVQDQFMQAFKAVTAGTQYGLTRYPAVVFDHGHSVVYGVTNLAEAVKFFRQWKARQ